MYSDFKGLIFNHLPFSHDASLIVVGLMIWLISGLVFRLPMTRLICVVPIIILGVAIEIADVMFLSQSPLRALSDFALLAVPVMVLVFFQHQGWARN